jgi:hypothetical protein
MSLPTEVIQQDRTLSKAANELMKLRWHWTLDETNPDRVGIREYARQVGRDMANISRDANAWADWLRARGDAQLGNTPGQPQTPEEFRQLRKLSGERQEAAKAVSATTGKALTTVTNTNRGREEIDAVVNTARERALDRGTTVDHEIQRAAEWREKTRRAARHERDEQKRKSTMRFVEIEGHVGAAMQRLRKILDSAEDVDFTDDERELIVESLGKLRALLNLIDLRIAGETNVDWDAEFESLVK